ncbi:endonuclease domain-containing 1 protein-like [Hemibagrus wyckioides]|uniref:endonuclease domain-containing 1 protein-like n=1 Tax=Hemibagrus wyckioides TaxID=337641 RepID=UPI00266B6715|nr:endonuclease domain-containing 1 protein-like [Hemibagrus wyckioides]XP_058258300.1 endonuclease domain-containing 1 protein-like [Hemibagrus wyckioides]XP_058258301.1 endonuclease domain-containing 1 protein-like [Hemibagrus wyckioides]XP_058258302.1 endonuclease domain-containing 1 protein-like [Hemibagrus wyckioides]
MKLLALVFLLSTFSSLTLTEVVNSFKQSCPNFFIRNPKKSSDIIIPTIFNGRQYKTICQRWKNEYRFATVYDTERRIPVYSAYTLLQAGETERCDEWKIEPQLENIEEYKDLKEMIDSPREAGKIFNQAVNSDYIGTGFTRGHVFPRQFAADQDQSDSTFTLTNIAPQTEDSNGQWARQVEEPMLKEIKQSCKLDQNHLAYIVTGVVPGENWVTIQRDGKEYQEGINIPSHAWSAYCCTSKDDIKKLIVKTYLAELGIFTLRRPDINKLNKRLTELYNKGIPFNVFPGLDVEDSHVDLIEPHGVHIRNESYI